MVHERMAVVLGASGGIGGAVARAMASSGYSVVRHFHTRPLPEERSMLDVQADLLSVDETAAMTKRVLKEAGAPDVVVNCTGRRRDGLVIVQDPTEWRETLEANVLSVYHPIRSFLPAMIRRRSGSFVTIASAAGPLASPGQSAYAASKGAVVALMRTLAREYGKWNIVFNTIAPSIVDTPMVADVSANVRAMLLERQSIPEMLTPDDLVDAVMLLAETRVITGQVLFVDRGLTL